MPDFRDYSLRYLGTRLGAIRKAVHHVVGTLDIEAWHSPEPLPFVRRRHGAHLRRRIGESWGRLFDCAWFHFTGRVPRAAAGHHVVLLLDVNGEMCVVDPNGTPVRGLTNAACHYPRSLGEPAKRVLDLLPRARRRTG